MTDWVTRARQIATEYGLNPDSFDRLIARESGYADDVINGTRRSSAGALGIAQFMPETAKAMGIDPLNPEQALQGAARLLVQNLKYYGGDADKAFAAYNAGAGNVDAAIKAGGDNWRSQLPSETQLYLNIINPSGGRGSHTVSTANPVGPDQNAMGPEGRAFRDITGTVYKSDKEREWYLAQEGRTVPPGGSSTMANPERVDLGGGAYMIWHPEVGKYAVHEMKVAQHLDITGNLVNGTPVDTIVFWEIPQPGTPHYAQAPKSTDTNAAASQTRAQLMAFPGAKLKSPTVIQAGGDLYVQKADGSDTWEYKGAAPASGSNKSIDLSNLASMETSGSSFNAHGQPVAKAQQSSFAGNSQGVPLPLDEKGNPIDYNLNSPTYQSYDIPQGDAGTLQTGSPGVTPEGGHPYPGGAWGATGTYTPAGSNSSMGFNSGMLSVYGHKVPVDPVSGLEQALQLINQRAGYLNQGFSPYEAYQHMTIPKSGTPTDYPSSAAPVSLPGTFAGGSQPGTYDPSLLKYQGTGATSFTGGRDSSPSSNGFATRNPILMVDAVTGEKLAVAGERGQEQVKVIPMGSGGFANVGVDDPTGPDRTSDYTGGNNMFALDPNKPVTTLPIENQSQFIGDPTGARPNPMNNYQNPLAHFARALNRWLTTSNGDFWNMDTGVTANQADRGKLLGYPQDPARGSWSKDPYGDSQQENLASYQRLGSPGSPMWQARGALNFAGQGDPQFSAAPVSGFANMVQNMPPRSRNAVRVLAA